MAKNLSNGRRGALQKLVHAILRLSMLRVAVVFVIAAVLVAMLMILTIDYLWDGRFSTELEFAGIVTAILDSLLIVGLLVALLGELRKEVVQRQAAELALRDVNQELEDKIQERMRQLQEMQEELVRKEKLALLGQVADTVGHELRNPLGVMNNAVYFLQTVLTDADETTREYLGIIKDEIADAERIVSDLLDAVRTKPPLPQMVEVAVLLEQTLGKCTVPPAVTVHMDIPEKFPAIRVDPGQMQQVLRNLIANAVEAMPDGGALDISAEADQAAKTVTISIRDSGSGITPENQARLFQPMFTTKVRRIGLGLAVVKNLTRVNGGSVEVESENGKGSRFCVTLPGGEDIVTPHAIVDKEEEIS